MMIVLLLAAALPPDVVPERINAILPSVHVSTRGLISDGTMLPIDGRGLNPSDELAGLEQSIDHGEEGLADLAEAVEEDRAEPIVEPADEADPADQATLR
jgi:hypothetical protein